MRFTNGSVPLWLMEYSVLEKGSFRDAMYSYLAQEQEVSQQMQHVRCFAGECLACQEDILWLLMVQHVLVGSVSHREDVRCIVRPVFEAVLGMEL